MNTDVVEQSVANARSIYPGAPQEACLTRSRNSHRPTKADPAELRYFADLSNEQAAKSLGITRRMAERYWTYARTWLLREIRKGQ